MANVAIYTDRLDTLLLDYGTVLALHKASVIYTGPRTRHFFESELSELSQLGQRDNIHFPGEELPRGPPADVYLVSGSPVRCFRAASDLPREKAVIVSSNLEVERRAAREGYRLETLPGRAIKLALAA